MVGVGSLVLAVLLSSAVPSAERALATPGAVVAGEALRERAAVRAFYLAREGRPAWQGSPEAEVSAAELLLATAASDRDGLDPARYHLATLHADTLSAGDRDVLLTDAFLALAGDLRDGRMRHVHTGEPPLDEVLAAALAGDDVGGTLASLAPGIREYGALRDSLRRFREITMRGEPSLVGPGPDLRTGDRGTRVAAMRARLEAFGDLAPAPERSAGDEFDDVAAAALCAFQRRLGLPETGLLDAPTRRALDVSAAARADAIVASLERLRWLPGDPGDPAVFVNVPAFELWMVRDGRTVLTSPVVVGRGGTPERETPVLDGRIESVVFAPAWEVPASIAREELGPRFASRPALATAERFRVVERATGREVPLESVAWDELSDPEPGIRLVQDPGPANPLGGVKIVFPNAHAIYLHDTPSKHLFDQAQRAASHGCIRVARIVDLAAALLTGTDWDEPAIRAAIEKGSTRTVTLPAPVPIHIVYLTSWVDDDGMAHFRRDLYGRDAALLRVLRARSSPSS